MTNLTRSAIGGLALAVVGCAGISVTTDYNPAAVPAMQDYQTYSWLEGGDRDDPQLNNPIVIGRITSAVDGVLAAKGYRKVASGGDFVVGWHADVNQRTDYNTVNSYYGAYGGGWGRWGYGGAGMSTSRTTEHNWQEGTLVILIADAKTKQLVWHGSATAEIGKEDSPDKRQAKVNSAVEKMFKDFPPGQ